MNRRALLTGLATLAVWPLPIRARVRKDLRVFVDSDTGLILEPRSVFDEWNFWHGPGPPEIESIVNA